MKKRATEKLIASMIRTIIAILIIAVGVICGKTAIHWQEWLPNGDYGILLITTMYVASMLVIGYGVYLVSPIYIGYTIYRLLEKGCNKITINAEDHEDDEAEVETFAEKVERLKEKYLW